MSDWRAAFPSYVLFGAGLVLALAIAVLNFDQPWLVVHMDAPQSSAAHLVGGPGEPLFLGPNRLQLKRVGTPVVLHAEPLKEGAYVLRQLEWCTGPVCAPVALDGVSAAQPATSLQRDEAGALRFEAAAAGADVHVPDPPQTWVWGSRAVVLALLLTLFFAVCWRRREDIATAGAQASLVCIFAIFAVQTLSYGAVGPHLDDWRYLAQGHGHPMAEHWPWWGDVANDTYYWTGLVLDQLVLRLSGGNWFVLRLAALATLGAFLAAMAGLLRRAVPPPVGAFAILLLTAALSTRSYWGMQAIAYHQFLPVLACTAVLALSALEMRSRALQLGLIALAAVASGLAYVSGAIAVVLIAFALLWVPAGPPGSGERRRRQADGALLLALGIVLVAFQLFMVTGRQGSLIEHNHAVKSVYPNDWHFWTYYFAQFGRAFGYTGYNGWIDGAFTLLALLPGAVIVGERALRRIARRPARPAEPAELIVTAAWLTALAYVGMVAFGRSGFALNFDNWTQTAWLAKFRFHYWWVAAWLPALVLGLWLCAQRWARFGGGLATLLALLLGAVLLTPKSQAAWDYATATAAYGVEEALGDSCVLRALDSRVLDAPECRSHVVVPELQSQFLPRVERDPWLLRYLHERVLRGSDPARSP